MIYLYRASLLLAGEFAPVACPGNGLYDIDGARHIAFGRHRAAKPVEARTTGVDALPDVVAGAKRFE
jgi:hypothetical protein